MRISKYMVSTTMGSTVLDPNAETYVKIAPYDYFGKQAADLKPGDLVLFAKPFATTEIEDVDPHLVKSPRYAKAKELLYDTNKNGEHIPILRGMLIRSLADYGAVSSDNLDARILKEVEDFTSKEYDAMTDILYDELTINDEPKRSRASLRNWLEGRVIAPRTNGWYLLGDVLAKKLNPEFGIFQYASEEPTSMYFNYRLYVTIRQGIMRFLRQSKGLPTEEEKIEGENLISLSPEYQIVFAHFMQDLTANYALARVTELQPLSREHSETVIKDRGRNAEQGVVRKSSDIRLPQRGLQNVWEDMTVLGAYLKAIAEDHEIEPYKAPGGKIWFDTPSDRCRYSQQILPYLLEYFGEPLDPLMKWFKESSPELYLEPGKGNRNPKDIFGIFGNLIRNSILSGEVDEAIKLPRGTAMNLLESYFRTRTAIPNRIYELIKNITAETIRLETRVPKISREFEREAEKIEEKYSIKMNSLRNGVLCRRLLSDTSILGLYLTDQMTIEKERGGEEHISVREFLDRIKDDKDKLLGFVNSTESQLKGEKLLTKKDIVDILKRYELANLVDIRKQDFYSSRVNLVKIPELRTRRILDPLDDLF